MTTRLIKPKANVTTSGDRQVFPSEPNLFHRLLQIQTGGKIPINKFRVEFGKSFITQTSSSGDFNC